MLCFFLSFDIIAHAMYLIWSDKGFYSINKKCTTLLFNLMINITFIFIIQLSIHTQCSFNCAKNTLQNIFLLKTKQNKTKPFL